MVWCAQALISVDDSLRRYAASMHDSLAERVEDKWHSEPHHADIILGVFACCVPCDAANV